MHRSGRMSVFLEADVKWTIPSLVWIPQGQRDGTLMSSFTFYVTLRILRKRELIPIYDPHLSPKSVSPTPCLCDTFLQTRLLELCINLAVRFSVLS